MPTGAMNGQKQCPRCGKVHVGVARYCGACGHDLTGAGNQAGRVPHPYPLPVPQGFQRCDNAADLYFRLESAWGGASLIGTESLAVVLFSAGFALSNVDLSVSGLDSTGHVVYTGRLTADQVLRGKIVVIEVPSYEINQPWSNVQVALTSAEYAANE